jgi:hypothetical protein
MASRDSDDPRNKSDYRIVKEGGWENMQHFGLSYGLKIQDTDDYKEMKQILDCFRQNDIEAYDEAKATR